MAAAGQDERNALGPQVGCHRPDAFALQIDVEDGEIEFAISNGGARFLDALADARDFMAEGQQEVFEHHRNERLVFDDENATHIGHARTNSIRFGSGKDYFAALAAMTTRTASASSCIEKGLGRKATFSISIDLRNCSSA